MQPLGRWGREQRREPHGRRDDVKHQGDRQPVEMARAYGPTPAWHDVQMAIHGPAVHDVETTFRERWEDSTPLTLNPGRIVSSPGTARSVARCSIG